MSQYFPKPYEPFGGDINVKVDLSNYATKTDLKNISHINVSSYALKSNLASLTTEVDKLDIGKLTSVPIDLAKLNHVVKNDVVKKTEYDKLVNKLNGIDNTNFVSRTKYEKDGSDFEDKIDKIKKKIPNVSNLVKKIDFNTKITEVEGKIPDISRLVTKSALTAVENKIPDISSLSTTSALTTVENKMPDISNLVTKTDFDAKLKAISDRVTKNKAKDLLLDNELKKLKTLNLSYFTGKNYFGSDNINYLVFEVSLTYLNFYGDSLGGPVLSWKSKGVFKEIIKAPRSNNKILSPITENIFSPQKIKLKFNGSCLIQDQITYTPQTIVNICIVYEITKKKTIIDYPALENCLFGSVKLTKNSDIDKYKYSGYGIGFDRRDEFSFGDGFGQNVIIFGADMSSSIHANNKTKNILVLGKGFTQKD